MSKKLVDQFWPSATYFLPYALPLRGEYVCTKTLSHPKQCGNPGAVELCFSQESVLFLKMKLLIIIELSVNTRR